MTLALTEDASSIIAKWLPAGEEGGLTLLITLWTYEAQVL